MRAGIGLGSNLGDREAALRSAIEAIRAFAAPPVLVSGFHETAPVGCAPGSPPFLNAAAEIGFDGAPLGLLDRLQAVERIHKRPDVREKNSPRTLDLDLLYCDDLVLSHPRLTLPHPLLASREFVLRPLSEIVPSRILPGRSESILQLLSRLS